MPNNLVFTTESTTDLSPEDIRKYGFGTIPLHVHLNGREYLDGVNIDAQKIYDTFQEMKILPSTSAVSVGEYVEFFKPYLDDGKDIIHLALSSGISATYQSACLAVEELDAEDRITVIDSKALSQAISIPMFKGYAMAEESKSKEEIVSAIRDMIPRLNKSFIITSLTFLKHGGRCSTLEAFGANLLKLKPVIDMPMPDGKMVVQTKLRGSDEKVYTEMIDNALKGVDYDDEFACVSHVLCDKKHINHVVNHLKKHYHFKTIKVNTCGCVITSHGGKGALAVFFLKK